MVRRLVFVAVLLTLAVPVSGQLENVGSLSFPTSASPAAQRHFLRGVAILHSFGWKQAIAEFQLAQKAEPDFALASSTQRAPCSPRASALPTAGGARTS